MTVLKLWQLLKAQLSMISTLSGIFTEIKFSCKLKAHSPILVIVLGNEILSSPLPIKDQSPISVRVYSSPL